MFWQEWILSASQTNDFGREVNMKKWCIVCTVILMVALICRAAPLGAAAEASPGEQAFLKNCAVCHPKGGNIIKPSDTLDNKTLEKHGIRGAADIVAKMRKPGPGMTQFDKTTIPDATAMAIAEYILKTFK